MQTYFINPSEDGWVLVEQGSDNVLEKSAQESRHSSSRCRTHAGQDRLGQGSQAQRPVLRGTHLPASQRSAPLAGLGAWLCWTWQHVRPVTR